MDFSDVVGARHVLSPGEFRRGLGRLFGFVNLRVEILPFAGPARGIGDTLLRRKSIAMGGHPAATDHVLLLLPLHYLLVRSFRNRTGLDTRATRSWHAPDCHHFGDGLRVFPLLLSTYGSTRGFLRLRVGVLELIALVEINSSQLTCY
jgi:hypothetical protein